MMTLWKRYRISIISIVVLVILFAVYSLYFTDGEETSLIRDSASGTISADQRELLALLSSLESVELNDALFATPEFRSLIDWSRELPPESVGRSNPFAPLGTF